MGNSHRWGITNKNRLYTIDDVLIEEVVTNLLIPQINRYNEYGGLDWRARFCENADETMQEFLHLETDKLPQLGPHSIPTPMGHKKGWYQEFVLRWGASVGFDTTFIQDAKASDYVKKMAVAAQWDLRRIRYEIIKESVNPQSAGRGFWNKTFDTQAGISAPPTWGVNTFTGSHNHYLTTGAATISNLDFFFDGMQHIDEHMDAGGDYICLMNSADINQLRKLVSFVGSNRANISNPATDQMVTQGINKEFEWGGITFVQEQNVPANYVVLLGGTGSQKPFKFHEPNNPQFRGLLWIEGNNGNYPWMDSYVFRQFAVRSFNRSQGVVYQITANANYSAPSDYA